MVGNGTDSGTCQCDSICCSLSKLPIIGGKGEGTGFGEFRTSLHQTNGSPECGIYLVWKSEVGQMFYAHQPAVKELVPTTSFKVCTSGLLPLQVRCGTLSK